VSCIPPNPPILAVRGAAVVAAIVVAIVVAGCGVVKPPSVDGLLVATGGPLQVTDGSGNLVAFDGPTDPVIRRHGFGRTGRRGDGRRRPQDVVRVGVAASLEGRRGPRPAGDGLPPDGGVTAWEEARPGRRRAAGCVI
jgi:hypothetical protein